MGFKKAPIKLSYNDLQTYTDNFSEENYISDFMFGKIYHGNITLPGFEHRMPVTIKIWAIPEWPMSYPNGDLERLMDEVVLLQNYSHPGLMKLYGYCFEPHKCGVVYDFKSLNTVQNLTKRDEFKWCQRIKVALQFAQLLKFFLVENSGIKPFVIRNISPAHIMVDEDWNPKLYDFGMVTGGPFPDKTWRPDFLRGCFGYEEPFRPITPKSDVYAFGAILLDMIMKVTYRYEEKENNHPCSTERAGFLYEGYPTDGCFPEDVFSKGETKPQHDNYMFSLVDESFGADESFCASDGPNITRLAYSCVAYDPKDRPSIHLVVRRLRKLKAVRTHLNHCIEGKVKTEMEEGKHSISLTQMDHLIY